MQKVRVVYFKGRFFAYHPNQGMDTFTIAAVYEPVSAMMPGIFHVAWGVPITPIEDPIYAVLATGEVETTHVVFLTPQKLVFVKAKDFAAREEMTKTAGPEGKTVAAHEIAFVHPRDFREAFLRIVKEKLGDSHVSIYDRVRPKQNKAGELELDHLELFARIVLDLVLAQFSRYRELVNT